MGRLYDQLSLDDRCAIASLHAQGRSIRQIAADLDRAPSTIARELKRNAGRQIGYKPAYAEEQAKARRWSGSRLERQKPLRDSVLAGLARGWSPEQVCGSLPRRHGPRLISPETIYRFIQAQIDRHTDYTCATTSRAPKANADAAAAEAAARPSTSRTASPSPNAPPPRKTAPPKDTGRPASSSSPATARPSSPCTSEPPASSSPSKPPERPQAPSPKPSPSCSPRCPR